MKVIVIGATGNQGSAVVRHGLAAGLDVSALVRNLNSSRAQALTRQGARLIFGDMDHSESLRQCLQFGTQE